VIAAVLDLKDLVDLKDPVVWLERLVPLESVDPKERLVPMVSQERRERKETPELPVLPVSQVLVVFREKLEILDRWDPRVLRAPLDTKVSVVLLEKKDHRETRDLRAPLVFLVDLVPRENEELLVPLVSPEPRVLKVHQDQEVFPEQLVSEVLRVIPELKVPRVHVEIKDPWVTLASLDLLVQEA